jgi:hypothetical protein
VHEHRYGMTCDNPDCVKGPGGTVNHAEGSAAIYDPVTYPVAPGWFRIDGSLFVADSGGAFAPDFCSVSCLSEYAGSIAFTTTLAEIDIHGTVTP